LSTKDYLQKQGQFYQALGTIEAVFLAGDSPGRGELVMQGQHFTAWVRGFMLKHLCPGEAQRLRVYPRFHKAESQWSFTIIALDNYQQSTPGEFLLKGNWLLIHQTPLLQVRQTRKGGKPFYLPLEWSKAPEPDAHFWMLQCHFRAGKMVVAQAAGPYLSPAQAQTQRLEALPAPVLSPKLAKSPVDSLSQTTSPPSITTIKAMAIPAKVEVTCKFSEVPQHRTVSEGVEFYLAQGERILTVTLKTKQFNKLLNHNYADWVAAVSGQLGAATATGFELSNASLQVFERQSKPVQVAEVPATVKEAATTQAKPASITPATENPPL